MDNTKMTAKRMHPRSPRLRINVTEPLILSAIPKHSGHCMIAEAVKKAYPAAQHISVDLQTIRFSDHQRHLRFTFLAPRVAQAALINFDQGRRPEPFSFLLRGGQVTKAGINHIKKAATKAQTEQRLQALRKAKLVRKNRGGRVAERIGGATPPLQLSADNVPFSRRRSFGLRQLEL